MSPLIGIYASEMSANLFQPAGDFDALARVTLSAPASSVTFAGIPSNYQHLQMRNISRNSSSAGSGISVTVNGITSNYGWQRLYGDGSNSVTDYSENNSSIFIQLNQTIDNNTANAFGVSILDMLNYASTSTCKTVRALHGWDANGSGNIILSAGNSGSTFPITSITLTSNASFVTNSSFALYGVK